MNADLRNLGAHYAEVAPLLLRCIDQAAQLSGLFASDGQSRFCQRSAWTQRSISLISRGMCHIRLRLGNECDLDRVVVRDGSRGQDVGAGKNGPALPPCSDDPGQDQMKPVIIGLWLNGASPPIKVAAGSLRGATRSGEERYMFFFPTNGPQ